MKKNQILAVGSVALDSVQTPFGKAQEVLGGSAVFFSAAARFFSSVSVVAVVGRDFPSRHWALLRRLGVDIRGIQTRPGKTFRWKGRYGYDLNAAKTLRTDLNVFRKFKPKILREHQSCRFIFLANIDPDIQRTVLNQIRQPLLTACDTMNFWIEHKKASLLKLLRRMDIFLCNDSEAREFSHEHNLIKASRWLLSQGPKIVVIKKGEHGVICFAKSFHFAAPAYPVEDVFDPTGAGDSFAGGFIGYLTRSPGLNEIHVRRAAIYGSVMASYNVESFSLDRIVKLRRAEINVRYKAFKKLTTF